MKTSSRLRPIASMMRVRSCPGLPHEREPLLVLVASRGLADEHELRVRVALAEDDVRPRLRELASRTALEEALEARQVRHGAGNGRRFGRRGPIEIDLGHAQIAEELQLVSGRAVAHRRQSIAGRAAVPRRGSREW